MSRCKGFSACGWSPPSSCLSGSPSAPGPTGSRSSSVSPGSSPSWSCSPSPVRPGPRRAGGPALRHRALPWRTRGRPERATRAPSARHGASAGRYPERAGRGRPWATPWHRSAVSRAAGTAGGHPVPLQPPRDGRNRRLPARPARHVRLRVPRRPDARARRRPPAAGAGRLGLSPRLSPRHRPRPRGRPPLGAGRPLGLADAPRRDAVGPRARPRAASRVVPPRRPAARRRARALDAAPDRLLVPLRREPAGALVGRPAPREPPPVAGVRKPGGPGAVPRARRARRPRRRASRRGAPRVLSPWPPSSPQPYRSSRSSSARSCCSGSAVAFLLARPARRLQMALVALPCALATAALVLGQGGETVRVALAPFDLARITRETLGLAPDRRLAVRALGLVLDRRVPRRAALRPRRGRPLAPRRRPGRRPRGDGPLRLASRPCVRRLGARGSAEPEVRERRGLPRRAVRPAAVAVHRGGPRPPRLDPRSPRGRARDPRARWPCPPRCSTP